MGRGDVWIDRTQENQKQLLFLPAMERSRNWKKAIDLSIERLEHGDRQTAKINHRPIDIMPLTLGAIFHDIALPPSISDRHSLLQMGREHLDATADRPAIYRPAAQTRRRGHQYFLDDILRR
jgi:hypothetical protein